MPLLVEIMRDPSFLALPSRQSANRSQSKCLQSSTSTAPYAPCSVEPSAFEPLPLLLPFSNVAPYPATLRPFSCKCGSKWGGWYSVHVHTKGDVRHSGVASRRGACRTRAMAPTFRPQMVFTKRYISDSRNSILTTWAYSHTTWTTCTNRSIRFLNMLTAWVFERLRFLRVSSRLWEKHQRDLRDKTGPRQ